MGRGCLSPFVHSELGLVVEKTWKGDVEGLDHLALERLKLLSQYGNILSPAVTLWFEPDSVTILQKWVNNPVRIDTVKSTQIAESLAAEVDMIHEKGLTHGDLCYSNVGLQGTDIVIFDWEPILVKRHSDGRVEYRTSKFALHPKDRQLQQLTALSDRFALIFLVLQITNERFDGLEIGKKHLDQISLLSESILCCKELVDHVMKLHWIA